jgi:hypothetical protein
MNALTVSAGAHRSNLQALAGGSLDFSGRPALLPVWHVCSNEAVDDGDLTNDLPVWWPYPAACAHGHRWGPGKITVAFRRCTCVGTEPGKGHTVVYCRASGCQDRWYTPAHDARYGAPG